MVDAIVPLTRLRGPDQEAQSRERWGSAVEIGAIVPLTRLRFPASGNPASYR
jgi:hypothetical protein